MMHSLTSLLLVASSCAFASPLAGPSSANVEVLERRGNVQPSFLKESDFKDNGGLSAAKAAVPYFLFAKDGDLNPCYPDSATAQGDSSKMNPGTDGDNGPTGPDPSENCAKPGDYNGVYSAGNPFPIYFSPKYCDNHKQWRMTYSLYYVHDGINGKGHKHDWESATVAWTQNGTDSWIRDQLILSQHEGYTKHDWGDIITVESATKDETTGLNGTYPKVFVGFFKHPNFPNKDTSQKDWDENDPDHEYRSDDWGYWADADALHPGSEIGDWNDGWDYGKANSDPWNIQGGKNGAQDICKFGDDKGILGGIFG